LATTVTETKAKQNHNEINDNENNESVNDQIIVEIDNDLPIKTETTQDINKISQNENIPNAIDDKVSNDEEEIISITDTESVNNFPPPPLELFDTKDDASESANENSLTEPYEINFENSDSNEIDIVKESSNNESEGCNLIDTSEIPVDDSLSVVELQDNPCNVIDSVISPPSTYSDAPTTSSNHDQIDETQDNEQTLESHSLQDIPPPLMCHEDSFENPLFPPPLEDTLFGSTNQDEVKPENITPPTVEDSFFSLPSEDSVLPPPLEDPMQPEGSIQPLAIEDTIQPTNIKDSMQPTDIEDPIQPQDFEVTGQPIPQTDNDSSSIVEKPISPPPTESSHMPLEEITPQCTIEPASLTNAEQSPVDEAAVNPNPWQNAESVDCYLSSEESDSENIIQALIVENESSTEQNNEDNCSSKLEIDEPKITFNDDLVKQPKILEENLDISLKTTTDNDDSQELDFDNSQEALKSVLNETNDSIEKVTNIEIDLEVNIEEKDKVQVNLIARAPHEITEILEDENLETAEVDMRPEPIAPFDEYSSTDTEFEKLEEIFKHDPNVCTSNNEDSYMDCYDIKKEDVNLPVITEVSESAEATDTDTTNSDNKKDSKTGSTEIFIDDIPIDTIEREITEDVQKIEDTKIDDSLSFNDQKESVVDITDTNQCNAVGCPHKNVETKSTITQTESELILKKKLFVDKQSFTTKSMEIDDYEIKEKVAMKSYVTQIDEDLNEKQEETIIAGPEEAIIKKSEEIINEKSKEVITEINDSIEPSIETPSPIVPKAEKKILFEEDANLGARSFYSLNILQSAPKLSTDDCSIEMTTNVPDPYYVKTQSLHKKKKKKKDKTAADINEDKHSKASKGLSKSEKNLTKILTVEF